MSAPTQQQHAQPWWSLREHIDPGLRELARIELWTHPHGQIALLAVPRERILIAPHYIPWLLLTSAQAIQCTLAKAARQDLRPPGALIAPHALPAAQVLLGVDYDQAYAVGFGKAHEVGLDFDATRTAVANYERSLAYMRGVHDATATAMATSTASAAGPPLSAPSGERSATRGGPRADPKGDPGEHR